MKHKVMMLLAILFSFTATAMAQNSIDDLVNRYSSYNTSKYTSAVERNPKTRAIVKVVKILEMKYPSNIQKIIESFKDEARHGDFSERKADNDLIMTLTQRGTTQNRIYMLKAENYYRDNGHPYPYKYYSNCSVTIIVKYK